MTETTRRRNKTESLDGDAEKIAKARKRRVALAKEQTQAEVDVSDSREDFRKYFLKLAKKLELSKYLEEVIWTHFKAIKHDKKELFDKGIEHFGYKI